MKKIPVIPYFSEGVGLFNSFDTPYYYYYCF